MDDRDDRGLRLGAMGGRAVNNGGITELSIGSATNICGENTFQFGIHLVRRAQKQSENLPSVANPWCPTFSPESINGPFVP